MAWSSLPHSRQLKKYVEVVSQSPTKHLGVCIDADGNASLKKHPLDKYISEEIVKSLSSKVPGCPPLPPHSRYLFQN